MAAPVALETPTTTTPTPNTNNSHSTNNTGGDTSWVSHRHSLWFGLFRCHEDKWRWWVALRGKYIQRMGAPFMYIPRVSYFGPFAPSIIDVGVLLLAIGALVLTILQTSANGSSGPPAVVSVAVMFCIPHHGALTQLFGMSFERLLVYHKFLAVWLLLLGFIHGVHAVFEKTDASFENVFTKYWFSEGGHYTSGSILLISFAMLTFTANFMIRRCWHEFFMVNHYVWTITALVFSIIHGNGGFIIGFGAFLFDILLRQVLIFACHTGRKVDGARLTVFSANDGSDRGQIIRIRWPRTSESGGKLDFEAGQYVWMCIPELSIWQYHPLSLSEPDRADCAQVHVRVLGDWSARLAQFASKSHPNGVRLILDGPVGVPSVDVDAFQNLLFVSGGIGITPNLSLANTVFTEFERYGRPVQNLWFVWVTSEQFLATDVFVSAQGSGILIPGGTECDMKTAVVTGTNGTDGTRVGDAKDQSERHTLIDKSAVCLQCEDVRKRDTFNDNVRVIIHVTRGSELCECVRSGRPDLPAIFREFREACGTDEGAVFACGPQALTDQSATLARQSDFRFHSEVFLF